LLGRGGTGEADEEADAAREGTSTIERDVTSGQLAIRYLRFVSDLNALSSVSAATLTMIPILK